MPSPTIETSQKIMMVRYTLSISLLTTYLIENNHFCPSVENSTLKPKASIPLKKVLSVSEITDDDMKRYKKLSKAPDLAFKIVFSKKHLVKKEYLPG